MMAHIHCLTDFIRKLFSSRTHSSSFMVLYTLKSFSLCPAHSLLCSMKACETSRHFISPLTHYLQLLSSAAVLDFFWIVFYLSIRMSKQCLPPNTPEGQGESSRNSTALIPDHDS